jgi:hypothetical protein
MSACPHSRELIPMTWILVRATARRLVGAPLVGALPVGTADTGRPQGPPLRKTEVLVPHRGLVRGTGVPPVSRHGQDGHATTHSGAPLERAVADPGNNRHTEGLPL